MRFVSDAQIRIFEKPAISCSDLRTLMCDYADGDLLLSLKDRLDQHILGCSDCLEFKESYLKTIKLASSLKPEPLSDDCRKRLRQALNERLGINLPIS